MNERMLFVMVGLPGAGKSTYAKYLSKEYIAEVFSSDELRQELLGDPHNQRENKKVFAVMRERMMNRLTYGNAVIDACNINRSKRERLLQRVKDVPCKKICVYVSTPAKECMKRNASRERRLSDKTIKKMKRNLDVPVLDEGWDAIVII